MKIAIVYNRDSQAVIRLFGKPNREKYDLDTIEKIKVALEQGGHQVEAFESDKHTIARLESFMAQEDQKEHGGMVFNLSYGIQGRARYTHLPAMLEMLGVPYVGSGPETHAIALDKVLTKIVLLHHGLPTPRFMVVERPEEALPLKDGLHYPLIVKPKDEAVSYGLRIVGNDEALVEGVRNIFEQFQCATLVEEYIEGREINVGLLGNDPVVSMPPCEILFDEGEHIYTYEDKKGFSGRTIRKEAPAQLDEALLQRISKLAVEAYKAIGCFDAARVDFRLDQNNEPTILEVNSMPSLTPEGSYVFAAGKMGLDYEALVNRLVEVATQRYFGRS